jgi:hypothetical protein
VEKIMGTRDFERPIFFRTDEGRPGNFRADNASDALSYMERFWSGARTREFRRAYAICESALKNLASAESARGYVVAAAEQAGILDRPKMLAMARSARRQVAEGMG